MSILGRRAAALSALGAIAACYRLYVDIDAVYRQGNFAGPILDAVFWLLCLAALVAAIAANNRDATRAQGLDADIAKHAADEQDLSERLEKSRREIVELEKRAVKAESRVKALEKERDTALAAVESVRTESQEAAERWMNERSELLRAARRQ